jgi:hypothetical protein
LLDLFPFPCFLKTASFLFLGSSYTDLASVASQSVLVLCALCEIGLLACFNDCFSGYPDSISLEYWQELQDFSQTLLSKDFTISVKGNVNKMIRIQQYD